MYEQIRRNRRASWLLAGLVVAMLAVLGFAIGYATLGGAPGGLGLLGVFGIVAIAWSIIGYYSGDKMVLAVSGARRVTHAEEPQLFNVVEEMTIAAGLPQVPAVYVLDEASPNALATGRDPEHASIAVTRGMMERLNREELQGVVAHEMAHIRNYDIRFETLVGILVGMIALIADFFLRWSFWGGMGRRRGGGSSGGDQASAIFAVIALVLALVAPAAAYAVQFAVSRRREYLADATAVELTRNPLGLAKALNKIAADPRRTTRSRVGRRSQAASNWSVPITLMSCRAREGFPGSGYQRIPAWTTVSAPVVGKRRASSGLRMSASMNSVPASSARGGVVSMPMTWSTRSSSSSLSASSVPQ